MNAKAGEKAKDNFELTCKGCHDKMNIKKGETVPECGCGNTEFDARMQHETSKSAHKK